MSHDFKVNYPFNSINQTSFTVNSKSEPAIRFPILFKNMQPRAQFQSTKAPWACKRLKTVGMRYLKTQNFAEKLEFKKNKGKEENTKKPLSDQGHGLASSRLKANVTGIIGDLYSAEWKLVSTGPTSMATTCSDEDGENCTLIKRPHISIKQREK